MNVLSFLTILFGLSALLLAYYILILREQKHLLSVTIIRLRWQYVHERQRANALKMSRDKLKQQRADDWATVEQMTDYIAVTDSRNEWLEQKRYVVLSRFWRRSKYRHLAAWRLVQR